LAESGYVNPTGAAEVVDAYQIAEQALGSGLGVVPIPADALRIGESGDG
jgi:hypothetical protein